MKVADLMNELNPDEKEAVENALKNAAMEFRDDAEHDDEHLVANAYKKMFGKKMQY